MKTYFLQVKEVIEETPDAATLVFWHPLSEQIKYKAGQFISLIVPADGGKKVRRSYSMSSSPHSDTAVAVTVKRVAGGLVSNYLLENVKKGDFIEVVEPMGHFVVEPDAATSKHYVLIGAGSGITPLFSIAKSVLKAEPNSRITMVYGNKNESHIIFRKELMLLENQYGERFSLAILLSQGSDNWAGLRGRINKANIVAILKEYNVHFKEEEFFLCGPEEMMNNLVDTFQIFELNPAQIHRENFHAPVLDEAKPTEDAEGLMAREIKVKYDGEEFTYIVEPHQSILEAALEQNIDLPYSCQAGMCTACLGKCTSGKVSMDEEDGLTQKEIEQGYVLTCVAHPLTADVVIEID